MNVTELARRLKVTTNQLHEALPSMGFDLGKRAIKVDEMVARKILHAWPVYQSKLQKEREAAKDAEILEQRESKEKETIVLPATISVRDFAERLNIPVTKLLTVLMNNGILTAMNEKIDADTASIIAEDLGFLTTREEYAPDLAPSNDVVRETQEAEGQLSPRPPVVVVMGHVDHGKTRLLDAIRKTNIIATESGGITQHIGAYQVVKQKKGANEKRTITFIDTPGHEAFTTMRSRGAKIADVAILVVAADDGVKPQTIEAIKIIKAANLPFVVAINKIDKPEANIDRVKRELSEHGVLSEGWGGETVCVPISAKEGQGIDDLLDMVILLADIDKEKIVANPNGKPLAVVVESHVDKNSGAIATLLIQNGSLSINDYLIFDGSLYGKIRSMRDHNGELVQTAYPGDPVQIIGFRVAPVIGYVLEGTKELAKEINKKSKLSSATAVVVTNKPSKAKEGIAQMNIILKTDTLGSLEAITQSLSKIDHADVKLTIVSRELGMVTSSDVLRAETTGAYIAAFHVQANTAAQELATEKGVEIKHYKIIYELLDDITHRTEELLAPSILKTVLGTGSVLAIFRKNPTGMIVGCRIEEGELAEGAKVAILREGTEIGQGKITQIQSGKIQVKKVGSGQECGVSFEGKAIIEPGDIIESFKKEKKVRHLDD